METTNNILLNILKEPSIYNTVTSIAKKSNLSRVGTWKALKKIDRLLKFKAIGPGKTSAEIIELNFDNILTIRYAEIALIEQAAGFQRWIDTFQRLEENTEFIILFGSILHSSKNANDIDIITVSNKNKVAGLNESILLIQKSQLKKIHATNFTPAEFKEELNKNNKIIVDALRTGIILSGQERFIKFMKALKQS
jgi:hypothetical protein